MQRIQYTGRMFGKTRWLYNRCAYKHAKLWHHQRSYNSFERHFQVIRRRAGATSAIVGATGVTVLAYFAAPSDVAMLPYYLFAATQRTMRVATTLGICINDYRRTLSIEGGNEDCRTNELKACHKRCAQRTLTAMERNGSIFIKLGQHLSSMGYLLPTEWTTTFVPLQDHCPVSSYESIEAMFLEDTGCPISEYFDTFEKVPIGAASLAQVHIATIKDSGRQVAVKVQHPALDRWVPLDVALTKFTFSTLKKFFPRYDLEWLSNEMEQSLPQELDFTIEGENAVKTKTHFAAIRNSPLLIPNVFWGRRRILVMEYVTGHRLDDLEYLSSNDIDRDEVSAALAHIFNEMIFGDTSLHCDPHGGNIAIRKNSSRRKHNFDIILYDHGLYREIPLGTRRNYAKLWLAVINADETNMRKYANDVAGIDEHHFPLFASAITGRDFTAMTKQSVVSLRTPQEKELITGALGDGLLQQLVQMLGRVPRIILLILKTNDLTRSLDENLKTRSGPVRNFLILAHYCSKSLLEEQLSSIHGSVTVLQPRNLVRFVRAWTSYLRVELRLALYESYVSLRRLLRLSPMKVQSI